MDSRQAVLTLFSFVPAVGSSEHASQFPGASSELRVQRELPPSHKHLCHACADLQPAAASAVGQSLLSTDICLVHVGWREEAQ